MNKLFKVSIIIFSFLILSIAGLVFVAKDHVEPEKLKKLTEQKLKEIFPQAKFNIGSFESRWGLSYQLIYKDVSLDLKKNSGFSNTNIFHVKELSFKIPLWAIIIPGGNIEVTVNEPLLTLEYGVKPLNSWSFASMNKQSNSKKNSNKKSKNIFENNQFELEVPLFVLESRINVNVSNLNFDVVNADGAFGKLDASKFLIKDLNLDKSTAFELVSNVEYILDDDSVNFNIKTLGEANLGSYIKGGDLPFSLYTSLSDIVLNESEDIIPLVTMKSKGSITQEALLEFETLFSIDNIASLKGKTILGMKELSFSNIEGEISLDKFFAFLDRVSEKVSISAFDISNLKNKKVNIKGSLVSSLPNLHFQPDLVVKSDEFPISLSGIRGNNSFTLSWVKSDLEINHLINILEGTVSSIMRTKMEFHQIPDRFENYSPISIDSTITNVKIHRGVVQNVLYQQKPKKLEEVVKTDGKDFLFPQIKFSVSGNNNFLDEESFELNVQAEAFLKKVEFKKVQVVSQEGKLLAKTDTLVETKKDVFTNFTINFEDFNMRNFNSFLPTRLSNVTGIYNGVAQGGVSSNINETSSMIVKVKAVDGRIPGFDVEKKLFELQASVKEISTSENLFTDEFKNLELEFTQSGDRLRISKLKLSGKEDSYYADLKGDISLKEENSELLGQVTLQEVKQKLKTELGMNSIPWKITGKGLELKTDVLYTTGKVADFKIQNKLK